MLVSFRHALKLGVAAAALAAATLPCAAHATVVATVAFSPAGLPGSIAGATQIAMPATGSYTFGTTTADGVTITTAGAGAVVHGSLTDAYAAPVTSGTAAIPTLLAANYVSTGGPTGNPATNGTVTLMFPGQEAYLGFLWGSVGAGDTISFYDTDVSTTVPEATFTGAQAQQTLGYSQDGSGARGAGGSLYTLVNMTGGTFNQVVLSQTDAPSFESGLFEYAATNIDIPEPTTLALLSTGVFGLRLIGRRRTSV
jgi:hypothetical protein